LSKCQRNLLEAEPAKELALSVVAEAGMTPIGEVAVTVTNGIDSGATVVIVVVPLKESHLSLHSWSELDYVAIDFFTCGDFGAARRAFQRLCGWFESGSSEIREIVRTAEVAEG